MIKSQTCPWLGEGNSRIQAEQEAKRREEEESGIAAGASSTPIHVEKKKEGKARNQFRCSRDAEKKEDEEEKDGKLKAERSRSTYLGFWSLGSALNQTESTRED